MKQKTSFIFKWTFWLGSVILVSSVISLIPGNEYSVTLFKGPWFMTLFEAFTGIAFLLSAVFNSKK